MVDSGIKPATSGFPTAVTLDTCIIQVTKDSAVNSARRGQNQVKEQTATTE